MFEKDAWKIEKHGTSEVRITAPEDLEETLAKHSVHLEDVIGVLTPRIAAALAEAASETEPSVYPTVQLTAEVDHLVEQAIAQCFDTNEELVDLLNKEVNRVSGGTLSGGILTRDDLIKAMKSSFDAGGAAGISDGIIVIRWNHSHGHRRDCTHSHN